MFSVIGIYKTTESAADLICCFETPLFQLHQTRLQIFSIAKWATFSPEQ